ncbi:MAG: prolipoprotein diacylglyceryl transferase [Candidatus Magnetominusculus sp. LBB02]|nr:prolipoprotein diacylglyceryl transferase [Candidatus Magnetominusculus sp. LBB02]
MGRLISFFLVEQSGCGAFSILSPGYVIFFTAAIVSFCVLVLIEMRHLRMSAAYYYIFLISLIFGFIGARTMQVILVAKDLSFSRAATGGMVFYGGLAGLYLGALVLLRVWKLSPFPYIDIVSLYVPLAHSFGRIGCFLAGCCFGRITQSSAGIHYPIGTPPYRQHVLHGLIGSASIKSLPVFPVQILESVINLMIFAVLYSKRNSQRDGRLTATYLVLYAACRFFIEFLRDDDIRGVFWGLSTAQYISAGLMTAVICLALLKPKSTGLSNKRPD